jgi:transposase
MARFQLLSGPERRRRWSEEQKRAIVAASFAPGTIVSNVARRADISSGQIYRWRQEFRATPVAGFTPVLIAPAEGPAANTEDGLTSRAAPAIELEFTGKVRVRIPVSVPPELAAAVVKALSRR